MELFSGLAAEYGHLLVSRPSEEPISAVVESYGDEYTFRGVAGDGGCGALVGDVEELYQSITTTTGQKAAVIV